MISKYNDNLYYLNDFGLNNQMSHKVKYKVISFSSEEQDFPVSSLLVPGTDGWNSKRFCNYPQEITLEFYGIVHVNKIELVSDSRKISSSIDILYYNPSEGGTQSRFSKYGSLQFSRNQNGRMRQQKTLMVDLKCLYLRFLLHKPYKSKQNFFSQVGLHQLIVFGGQSNAMLPMEPIGNKQQNFGIDQKSLNDEQDQFVYEKMLQLNAEKQKAINEEDYDQANRLKEVMVQIKKYGYILKGLKDNKQKAIENEDYDEAKRIKDQIERNKVQIEELLTGEAEYEEEHQRNRMNFQDDIQDNEFVDPEINKMLDRHSLQDSGVSQKESKLKNSSLKYKKRQNIEQSYDERVVPALMNKVKTEQSQQANFQPKQEEEINAEPEDIDGKFATDAQNMGEYFDERTIKEFFSKNWKLKMKGLTTIQKDAGSKKGDASLIKCLLGVVKNSLFEPNFQIAQMSLNLLQQTLKMNATTHKVGKTSDMANDLDKIIQEIVRRLSDNNAKIKSTSEQVFEEMMSSSLYGVEVCCAVLMNSKGKSKAKLSSKQEIQRLSELGKIVSKFGLGSNSAPYSVIDYGVSRLDNPSGDVRNEALNLLAACANVEGDRVWQKVQGSKVDYRKQIEARQQEVKGGKKKKK